MLYEYKNKQRRPAALSSDEAALSSDEVATIEVSRVEKYAAVTHERDHEYDHFGFKTFWKSRPSARARQDCRATTLAAESGFKTVEKSHLLRVHGKIVERPQHMLLRVACGIHSGDVKAAIETRSC